MNPSSRSPTPWKWVTDGAFTSLQDANGDAVISYTNEDDGLHATPEDAALIAAAPELLSALKEMIKCYDDDDNHPGSQGHDLKDCVLCQARQAISKAKGKL